jgi:hypothetical protein
MKKGVGVLFYIVLSLVFASFGIADTAQITLTGDENCGGHLGQIADSFKAIEGNFCLHKRLPAANPYYDYYCFVSNFSDHPTVKGKKMLSASYVSGGVEYRSNGAPCFVFYDGSDWQTRCPSSSRFMVYILGGPFVCDVEFTDFVTCPLSTCTNYPRKCGNALSDNCGGEIDCSSECKTNENCNTDGDCVCDLNYRDCNFDWSDGCEVFILGNDVTNCGGCGSLDSSFICLSGETCENGVCTPSLPEFNSWSNMNGGSISQVDILDYVRLNSNENLPYQIIGDVVDVEINNKYWQANVSDNNIKFVTSVGDSETTINVLDDSDNEELTVDVLSPKCGANYSLVGEKLNISFTIDDSDDLVFVNVSVDSEVMYSVNNFVKNKFEFVSDFERSGSVSVVFSGVSSRGDKFRKVSNIMVYDTTNSADQYYVAACIDKPVNFYETKSSLVEFEATSSRAIKYNNLMTEPEEIDDEYLNFSWSFWNQGGKVLDDCVGLGSQDCNGQEAVDWSVIHFFRRFPTIHDNQATLSVSIPAEAMV